MKIPNNHTEQEVFTIMKKVIDRISPKYVFYGYTIDDIKQESYILCIEALERYDQDRPLENFLSVNLSNRLKNFVRDNYFIMSNEEKNDSKMKLLQPAQLEYEFNIIDDETPSEDEVIDIYEISGLIDRELPASMRMDYLKLIEGMYISKSRRDEILDFINDILAENGYEKRQIF